MLPIGNTGNGIQRHIPLWTGICCNGKYRFGIEIINGLDYKSGQDMTGLLIST